MRFTAIVIGLLCVFPLCAQPAPDQPPPEALLKEVLQLTAAQLASIQQLAQTRQQSIQPLLQQIGTQQQALAAALEAGTPDPAAMGRILTAIHDLQRQVEQVQRNYADSFLNVLTDAQRTQVQQIRSIETALRAAAALHALGL